MKTVIFREGGGCAGGDGPRQRAIMEAAVRVLVPLQTLQHTLLFWPCRTSRQVQTL